MMKDVVSMPGRVVRFCLLLVLLLPGVACAAQSAESAAGVGRAPRVDLTAAEKRWLIDHATTIRLGVIDIPPLVMADNAGSEMRGMSIQFMRLYEDRLNIRFKTVVYPDWKSLLEAMRTRQVDALLTAVNTPEQRRFLDFPEPYITLKNVLIARQGEVSGVLDLDALSEKRVAVLEASAVHERMEKEFPEVRVLPVRDERALLASVMLRDVDFAVAELSRVVWWIQHEKQGSLEVVGDTPFDYPLSLAVRNDWVELGSALDKATRSFSIEESEGIARLWRRQDSAAWMAPEGEQDGSTWRMAALVTALVTLFVGLFFMQRHIHRRTGALQAQLETAEAARMQAEAAEKKFRALAELTSDVFWETNERLVFTSCHGGGVGSYAAWIDEGAMLGKAWWDLPIVAASRSNEGFLQALMNGRESFQRRIGRWSGADGSVRWIAVSGQPYFDLRSNFLGYRGTWQDVTQREEQALKLLEALQRMEAIQNGTLSFSGLLSPDGKMIECNRAAVDFVGVEKGEVLGQLFWTLPWWRIEEESARLEVAVGRARSGEFVRYEARVVDAVGIVHWVDFSLSPFFDEYGKLLYLVPEARDITEAKRASALLDNLMSSTGGVYGEDFFRKLVESMGRLLSVRYVFAGELMSGQRRIRTLAVWASGRLADNFEYALDHTPCAQVMDASCCIFPRNVQEQFPQDFLLQEMGVESYMGVPILGSSGQASGLLVVLHDKPLADTEQARRMMELFAVRASTEMDRMRYLQEIKTLNTGLEARVAERTEALQQANRELEAFSYSVSHDLRAPLRHIAGFIEMLGDDTETRLSAEGQRYMRIIGDSARRMGVMIDDLLALSRAGRSELRKAPVDLRQLVQDVIESAKNGIGDRQVQWAVGKLPVVQADRGLLTLALNNLIENAVKYSRGRDVAQISVDVADPAQETPDEWVLVVRDNGIGFDMKYVGKLFGVFHRLHADEDYEGTGIGLANVRRIVERHGGRVWAESAPGQGAAFYFTLPRQAQQHEGLGGVAQAV